MNPNPLGLRLVRKRNGAVVPFDPKRIRRALLLCFNATRLASKLGGGVTEEEEVADAITTAIVNVLNGSGAAEPGVEDIQRLVLQQLWARGLFDAAENYQNYREERRKARLKAPVEDAVR